MEMVLGGFNGCPIVGGNEAIARASKYQFIRMVTMQKIKSEEPMEYAPASWKVASPHNLVNWSAVSFFFAQTLQKTLKVPIGIISAAWGNSPVQGFMSKELLEKLGEHDPHYVHSTMYNSLIYPVRRYTIKGFIWYQGAANVGQEKTWLRCMTANIEDWRAMWGLGELPFILSIIGPFEFKPHGRHGALLREAQMRVPSMVPNCAIVNTIDLAFPYERHQIHAAQKRALGQRYAWIALNRVYKYGDVAWDGPRYERGWVQGSEFWCLSSQFGIFARGDIAGLEIAGEDKVFHPGFGVVDQRNRRSVIIVASPNVTKPVAVRYCFKDFQVGNVFNARNIPMFPFRTDNWTIPEEPDDFWETFISKLSIN
jgi:sialate O-acetylesterase